MHTNLSTIKKSQMSTRSFSNYTLTEKCPYFKFLWSESGKIRTRKISNMDTFHVIIVPIILSERKRL